MKMPPTEIPTSVPFSPPVFRVWLVILVLACYQLNSHIPYSTFYTGMSAPCLVYYNNKKNAKGEEYALTGCIRRLHFGARIPCKTTRVEGHGRRHVGRVQHSDLGPSSLTRTRPKKPPDVRRLYSQATKT